LSSTLLHAGFQYYYLPAGTTRALAANGKTGKYKFLRWVRNRKSPAQPILNTGKTRMVKQSQRKIQQPDSFAAALYLPSLKAGVSREVN
jgi:hypothetical protein